MGSPLFDIRKSHLLITELLTNFGRKTEELNRLKNSIDVAWNDIRIGSSEFLLQPDFSVEVRHHWTAEQKRKTILWAWSARNVFNPYWDIKEVCCYLRYRTKLWRQVFKNRLRGGPQNGPKKAVTENNSRDTNPNISDVTSLSNITQYYWVSVIFKLSHFWVLTIT